MLINVKGVLCRYTVNKSLANRSKPTEHCENDNTVGVNMLSSNLTELYLTVLSKHFNQATVPLRLYALKLPDLIHHHILFILRYT